MTRIASISHGQDGYAVELTEIPLRWQVAGRAGEAFLAATGHLLCCNLRDWMWKIRWGPRDEEFGLADRSLGHLLYEAGQWLSCLEFRHEGNRVLIPVSPEWVQEHYPDIREEFRFLEDSTGPDSMTATFSNT